ncbi:MAG: YiiX/YebB-like N1pC/P60 family cysteine hydrolase [Candidatus Binatia bacterium]
MAFGLPRRMRRWLVDFTLRLLTKPLRSYEQRIPNSLPRLQEQLRPGDVVLVEGDQRISQVIRYLTQSSWSHSALYIGDELRRLDPVLADALVAEHGEAARFLLLEATVEAGVACAPVAKYVGYNLRICRPHGLRREDLDRVVEELVGQLGRRYDVRHVFELGRYFFPVSLIPRRFRRAALQYGSGSARDVICSSMLARAFAHVGYPVLPRVTVDEYPEQVGWFRRLFGHEGRPVRTLYRRANPALITPRDFDLSPYFDIVKFNYLAMGKFDYRRITWVRDDEAAATPETVAREAEPPASAPQAKLSGP